MAPFAAPGFTLELSGVVGAPIVRHGSSKTEMKKASAAPQLSAGTWTEAGGEGRIIVCFDLEKGTTTISA